jgi:hypothetical protein
VLPRNLVVIAVLAIGIGVTATVVKMWPLTSGDPNKSVMCPTDDMWIGEPPDGCPEIREVTDEAGYFRGFEQRTSSGWEPIENVWPTTRETMRWNTPGWEDALFFGGVSLLAYFLIVGVVLSARALR